MSEISPRKVRTYSKVTFLFPWATRIFRQVFRNKKIFPNSKQYFQSMYCMHKDGYFAQFSKFFFQKSFAQKCSGEKGKAQSSRSLLPDKWKTFSDGYNYAVAKRSYVASFSFLPPILAEKWLVKIFVPQASVTLREKPPQAESILSKKLFPPLFLEKWFDCTEKILFNQIPIHRSALCSN